MAATIRWPYVRWTERENMRAFLDLVADGRVRCRPAHFAPVPDRRGRARLRNARARKRARHRARVSRRHGARARARHASPSHRRSVRRSHQPGRARASASSGRATSPRRCCCRHSDARTVFSFAARWPPRACRRARRPTSSSSRTRATDAIDVWRDQRLQRGGDRDAPRCARVAGHRRRSRRARPCSSRSRCAVTEVELDAIVATADACSCAGTAPFVMVGFNRRFAPAVAFDQERISTEIQGPVSHRLSRERRARAARQLGGGSRARRRPDPRRGVSLRGSLQLSGRRADHQVSASGSRQTPTT